MQNFTQVIELAMRETLEKAVEEALEEKQEEVSAPKGGVGGETPKEDFVKPQKIEGDTKAIEEKKQEYEKNLESGEVKETLEGEESPKVESVKPQQIQESNVDGKKPVNEDSKNNNVVDNNANNKKGLVEGNSKEEPPKIPGIENLPKEKIEEDIKIIEKEKQEYLKEHPEEKEEEEPASEGELGGESPKEEFDEEPEFKDEKGINKKDDDGILDIF